tara:strand:+ start:71 stop:508 length:438 start_codon:yes stop_codon:yes gene_type:complete
MSDSLAVKGHAHLGSHKYNKLVKFGAVYDLLATSLLMLPFLVAPILGVIMQLDSAMGFNSTFKPLDSTSLFLICLGACYVTIWGVFRFLNPSYQVGRLDAILRFTVAIIQIICVGMGATPILLGITAVLITLGLVQWFMAESLSE